MEIEVPPDAMKVPTLGFVLANCGPGVVSASGTTPMAASGVRTVLSDAKTG
jgi:hypothetical protein